MQSIGGFTATTQLEHMPISLPSGINLDALDGTAGRTGPRSWNDTAEQRAQPRSFEDTTAQHVLKVRILQRAARLVEHVPAHPQAQQHWSATAAKFV